MASLGAHFAFDDSMAYRLLVVWLSLGLALVGWAEDEVSEATARERCAEYLQERDPGSSIDTFERIARKGDELAEVRREYTVFRATTTRQEGSFRILVLLFDRAGEMSVWEGEDRVPALQAILERCELRATDEASVRRAGLVCLLMPVESKYEPERVEVSGRVFIYHQHLLVLMSGRLGVYREDIVVRFDTEGRLESYEVTGYPDLTVEQLHQLTGDPDPWLQVIGAVPDDLKDRVSAKSGHRKLPIGHPGK